MDTAGLRAPRIRAGYLQPERRPASRTTHCRTNHRRPHTDYPVDRPGNYRRRRRSIQRGCAEPAGQPRVDITTAPATFTGEPSIVSQVFTGVLSGRRCGRGLLGCGSRNPAIEAAIECPSAVVYHAGTGRAAQSVRGDAGVDSAVQGVNVGKDCRGRPWERVRCPADPLSLAQLRCHGAQHRRHRRRADLPTGATERHRPYGRARHRGLDLLAHQSARGRERQCVRRLVRRHHRACRSAGVGASRRPGAVAHGADFTGTRSHLQ